MLDIKLIMSMLRYHIHKAVSAIAYSSFIQLGDIGKLPVAITELEQAIAHWEALVAQAKGKYHSRLVFGVGGTVYRDGTWSDYLPELYDDLEKLRSLAAANTVRPKPYERNTSQVAALSWSSNVPTHHKAGTPLAIELKADSSRIRGSVYMRYRHTNLLEGEFVSQEMEYANENVYRAVIPAEYLVYEWDLLVFFEAVNDGGDGLRYPGLWHPLCQQPYYIIAIER